MSRAIHIRDLSIMSTTGDPVLRDVNADIHVGEVALVSGSCGSGKTLLLKAIAGLVQSIYTGLRVSGYIEVYGYSPLDALKNGLVAYIPQDIALAGYGILLQFALQAKTVRQSLLSRGALNADVEEAFMKGFALALGLIALRLGTAFSLSIFTPLMKTFIQSWIVFIPNQYIILGVGLGVSVFHRVFMMSDISRNTLKSNQKPLESAFHRC